jgi:hypothetical protein
MNIDKRPVEVAFWSNVDEVGDCWEWMGSRTSSGYGQFRHQRMRAGAHRWAWSWANDAPIPAGAYVCHTCDNPPCVRPSHLWVGDVLANTRDAVAKGRMPRGGAIHGAKLDEAAVEEMRLAYAAGGVTQERLAATYGINVATANAILRGRIWRHAGGPLAPQQKGHRTPEERTERKAAMDRARHLRRRPALHGRDEE